MIDTEGLIRHAVENKADVSYVQKIIELHEKEGLAERRKKYFAAKSKFQGELPEILKKKKVNYQLKAGGAIKYSYAQLSSIINDIKLALRGNGFSYTWEFEEKENKIICTCTLSHEEGYSERATISCVADVTGSKNELQQKGSSLSYLERYTLNAVAGIATADDTDDDGHAASPPIDYDSLSKKLQEKKSDITEEQYLAGIKILESKQRANFAKLEKFLNGK